MSVDAEGPIEVGDLIAAKSSDLIAEVIEIGPGFVERKTALIRYLKSGQNSTVYLDQFRKVEG